MSGGSFLFVGKGGRGGRVQGSQILLFVLDGVTEKKV